MARDEIFLWLVHRKCRIASMGVVGRGLPALGASIDMPPQSIFVQWIYQPGECLWHRATRHYPELYSVDVLRRNMLSQD